MITADQLLAHSIGDYILQSDWMAQNKTKAHAPALIHAFVYTLCFTPIGYGHPLAGIVIFATHFLIDRYRLARYVVWAKNWLAPEKWTPPLNGMRFPEPRNPSFAECAKTGYPPSTPDWLAVWLLIIADNIMHVAINGAALKWL